MKKTPIPYKQLKEENKVLGNIISALKSNKTEWDEEKGTLQNHIHQISAQFVDINSENEALRNITAELRRELRSIKRGAGADDEQALPPQLEATLSVESNPTPQPKSVHASNRSSARSSRSMSSFAEICAHSQRVSFEVDPALCPQTMAMARRSSARSVRRASARLSDEVHCLKQQIHKLQMEKVDLVRGSQQNVQRLQEMVASQQSLQLKLTHCENDNARLRAQANSNENNDESLASTEQRELQKVVRKLGSVTNLSFEEVVEEIKRLERENESQRGLKAQMFALHDENLKLKERLTQKQIENASIFEKYNVTLTQYHILCKHYLK